MYVSITGLELKGVWHAPCFWWHAIRSMQQARAADGNLYADTRTINGVHHTLSVWRDEQAMRAYLISGPHRKAMRAFHSIATGKTLGFTADQRPDWTEVHDLWQTKGRAVEAG
jgi:hypothetical protein